MSQLRRAALATALVACPALFVVHFTAIGQPDTGPAAFNPSRPETWDASVAQLKLREDELVKSLIAVASDEKQDAATRQKAVLTLSSLRNRRCLEFLISNAGLRLGGGIWLSPEDMAKATPCLYVLSQERDCSIHTGDRGPLSGKRTDWTSAQAILFALRNDARRPDDLMLLAHALEIILGPDLATAAVDDTLKQRTFPESTVWRKNLTGLKTYLEHK